MFTVCCALHQYKTVVITSRAFSYACGSLLEFQQQHFQGEFVPPLFLALFYWASDERVVIFPNIYQNSPQVADLVFDQID